MKKWDSVYILPENFISTLQYSLNTESNKIFLLYFQMGAALVEKIMDTFLTLFTEAQLQSLMLMEGTGVRVVEKFLFILQVFMSPVS